MSEFNASNFKKEQGGGAPDLLGLTELKSPHYFVPPSGTTKERPQSAAPGTLRFNTDAGTLEIYRGDTIGWSFIEKAANQHLGREVAADTTASGNGSGDRGVFMGANLSPGGNNSHTDFINISTMGNAVNFGNRTISGLSGSTSSRTRGLCAGSGAPSYVNTIDFITLSSTGNATDFGDRTNTAARNNGCSNQIRAMFAGGFIAPAVQDTIDYVTIAQTGNAVDFGNLSGNREDPIGNINSTTRAIWAGGNASGSGANENSIDFVTITTTGNGQDFGDLIQKYNIGAGGCNSIRGLICGGYESPSGAVNTIEFVTIATTGNSVDFGDRTVTQYRLGAVSNSRRVVMGGGAPSFTNVMDSVQIASTGNAQDFGDMVAQAQRQGGCSTGHGGL